jgi:hypothetical protein
MAFTNAHHFTIAQLTAINVGEVTHAEDSGASSCTLFLQ